MAIEEIRSVLGWCTLINYAVLLYWFAMFRFAHDRVQQIHGRWFSIPTETFDTVHYALMGVFKLGIFVFNVVPWIAIHIVT